MEDKSFIFIAGLHRSGTSLVHEIMREHPDISGFQDTGAWEDEGQHLQSVFATAKTYGGPGKFVFDERSYMDENHPLATEESAEKIFQEWSQYYDLSCNYLIEKSPPNLIRTRFLQRLFPSSKYIVVLRHPIAVSYATQKWSKTSLASLLDHTLTAYETFFKDVSFLKSAYILRYEQLIDDPENTMDHIFKFLNLEPFKSSHEIRKNINDKYFKMWEADKQKILNRLFGNLASKFEDRAVACGYSIVNPNEQVSVPWLGEHQCMEQQSA